MWKLKGIHSFYLYNVNIFLLNVNTHLNKYEIKNIVFTKKNLLQILHYFLSSTKLSKMD